MLLGKLTLRPRVAYELCEVRLQSRWHVLPLVLRGRYGYTSQEGDVHDRTGGPHWLGKTKTQHPRDRRPYRTDYRTSL